MNLYEMYFRSMWNWLSNNPGKEKHEWPGMKYVENVSGEDFACAEMLRLGGKKCDLCPLNKDTLALTPEEISTHKQNFKNYTKYPGPELKCEVVFVWGKYSTEIRDIQHCCKKLKELCPTFNLSPTDINMYNKYVLEAKKLAIKIHNSWK